MKPKVEEKKCNKHTEVNELKLTELNKLGDCVVSKDLAIKLSSDLKDLIESHEEILKSHKSKKKELVESHEETLKDHQSRYSDLYQKFAEVNNQNEEIMLIKN